ncbi:MAG TPA: peptide ABC transporter substrate-binding protein [Thermomicrobiales bacterium]|nr:peptide ABC transporter substrate-binding protein [Thermomicrobiales bacterium]
MEHDPRKGLERLQEEVLAGRLSRRDVLKRGAALGLSAPIVAGLLAACGDDDDPTAAPDTAPTTAPQPSDAPTATTEAAPTTAPGEPTNTPAPAPTAAPAEPTATADPGAVAGGHGLLRLLWWQAVTIINPHLAQGTKDYDASQICLEPLANFNSAGELVPCLAEEVPSLENGGVSEDGRSVTWKLRQGVKWHDGEDFTADDVRFTWEYATNDAVTSTTFASFRIAEDVQVVDDYTVTLTFADPNPAWYATFVGPQGMVLPEHVFAEFNGANARDAPANLAPIGTGPFRVSEFRPGDTVLYERFEDYWDPGKPYFDSVEMKGGGDSAGAARAVLASGEADWAWNVQVEPAVLAQMATGGTGVVTTGPGSSAERVMVNFADPNTEVDGARSEPTTNHPIFQHKEARNAIALSIQRDVINEQLYGAGGVPTSNNLNAPAPFVSPNTSWEFDLAAAQALLDSVGVTGGDLIFQTSINAVRQKTQEIIKQDLEQLGFAVEIKAVDAAVFFSSDAGNPDTYGHFYADLEMYTNGPSSPYPITWAERYRSDQLASKENDWSGVNITRWNNPEFDVLHDEAITALDPARQAELFIAMNDMSVNEFVEIPIIHRASVAAAAADLEGFDQATFMSDIWDIKEWRRSGM